MNCNAQQKRELLVVSQNEDIFSSLKASSDKEQEMQMFQSHLIPHSNNGPQESSNKLQNTPQLSFFQEKIFFFQSLGVSLGFALHNYVVSSTMAKYHPSGTIVFGQGFIYVVQFIFYNLYHMYLDKKHTGSYYFNLFRFSQDKDEKKKEQLFSLMILMRSSVVVVGTANVSLVTHYARLAGVSPSVCLSVTILTSFVSALMFYLIYNEKLNCNHWAGMTSIMFGVFIIGLSKPSGQGSDIQQQDLHEEVPVDNSLSQLLKIAIPISISLFNCILYTIAALITRFTINRGYPKVKFAIDLTGMAGVLYLCGFTYCQLYANLKFTFLVVAFMTLAGSFCYSAFLFQVYAVQSGKGAIVQAIANTQCVIQLLLEIVLDGRIPSGFEITSMCLCISGAFIIAMAKK